MPTEGTAGLIVRPGQGADLAELAELYLRARAAAAPAMPPSAYGPEQVRAWVSGWDLDRYELWVAQADGPVGYALIEDDWLHSLYVDPASQRAGVGSALLEVVKAVRPGGFCLWVFETNLAAREFYAGRGLVELERTDGSGNEERSPDLRLAWPGTDPLGFLRSLIDEVDEQLGDLLARRAALTRAVQLHKHDRTRDPIREREIAAGLARRAPELGEERLARIVDVIVTESLDAAP